MGYNKPNPLKMMESALKMYKAEKKGGMHRMESPMYAKEVSKELKWIILVKETKNRIQKKHMVHQQWLLSQIF
jgi:hypothetical protein